MDLFEVLHGTPKRVLLATAAALSMIVCLGVVGYHHRKLFAYKSNKQILEAKNALLLENYEGIESFINQIVSVNHEAHNHLLAIKILLDDGEYDRLAKYLTDILGSHHLATEPIFCGHRLIQSILGHANQRAHLIGVETKFEVSKLPPMSITDADAVSMLMNLLNNALEACENVQPPDKRWITVAIKFRAPYLYISVKNALCGEIRSKNGIIATTKKDVAFHGYGTSIVREIAKKYDGFATFKHTEDSFSAEAALRVIVE